MQYLNKERKISVEQLVQRLGGEHLLRTEFPGLYKAYLYSLEREKTVKEAVRSLRTDDGNNIIGTKNSFKIRTINYSPKSTLVTTSSAETIEEKKSIAITGNISNVESGKELGKFEVCNHNCRGVIGSCELDASAVDLSDSRDFKARATSTFTVIDEDTDGKVFLTGLETSMESLKVKNEVGAVESVKVDAPVPRYHEGAESTIVAYNRSWKDADYSYEKVSYSDTQIDVYMPVSGSVVFSKDCEIDNINPVDKNGMKLELEHFKESCAVFDRVYFDDIEFAIEGSRLSWKFPDNWHNVIDKTNIASGTKLGLYMLLPVILSDGTIVEIVVSSDDQEHEDPSFKKIQPIQIYWGCFAKHTLIKMVDGSQKRADLIKKGDTVMTRDAGVQAVKNIISGEEKKLIYIENDYGDKLFVTETHPIMTDKGMVQAKNLTAGSVLEMERKMSGIKSLYYVDYNDTVYNFELETSSALIANNIFAGDYLMQNEAETSTKKSQVKLTAEQEELDALIEKLKAE